MIYDKNTIPSIKSVKGFIDTDSNLDDFEIVCIDTTQKSISFHPFNKNGDLYMIGNEVDTHKVFPETVDITIEMYNGSTTNVTWERKSDK